jgi:hypothetical protein
MKIEKDEKTGGITITNGLQKFHIFATITWDGEKERVELEVLEDKWIEQGKSLVPRNSS